MFIYTIQDIAVGIVGLICIIGLSVAFLLDKLYQKANWFRKWYDKKYPRKQRYRG